MWMKIGCKLVFFVGPCLHSSSVSFSLCRSHLSNIYYTHLYYQQLVRENFYLGDNPYFFKTRINPSMYFNHFKLDFQSVKYSATPTTCLLFHYIHCLFLLLLTTCWKSSSYVSSIRSIPFIYIQTSCEYGHVLHLSMVSSGLVSQ